MCLWRLLSFVSQYDTENQREQPSDHETEAAK